MSFRSEDACTAELQAILRVAHSLRDAVGVSSQPPIINGLHAVTDSIDLPSPHPLLPSLLGAGFNHEIAASISGVYQLRAEELKRRMRKSIITACSEIVGLPVVALALSPDEFMRRVVFTFTELYLRRLEQWKEQIIQHINQVPKTPTKAAPRNSRTFNQDYVPLLEHFFEENPFPTHADKMFLAKKSNMEYRQIHVWFQNRRSRTKKEGKALKKKPTYERATKPLDKLYERMKGHMVGSDSQAPTLSRVGSSEIKVTQNNMSDDAFVSSSPSHAFPSSYPPTCDYDPFPCKNGPVCFGKPEWRRVPDGKLPLSPSTNIDDLVERFSYLNVRDETRSRGSLKLQSHAATAAITVIPSCAPHPSLMIPKYSQPRNVVQLPPLARARVSCSKAFQILSPTSKPVTLVPSSVPPNKSELHGKRKTAPLPRRFPGRARNTCRDTTPSDSSSTSSSSPRLFSADPESRSCSFSSVPMPPDAGNIQELPFLFGSSCRSPFDSPVHLLGLGDMAAISPSCVS